MESRSPFRALTTQLFEASRTEAITDTGSLCQPQEPVSIHTKSVTSTLFALGYSDEAPVSYRIAMTRCSIFEALSLLFSCFTITCHHECNILDKYS